MGQQCRTGRGGGRDNEERRAESALLKAKRRRKRERERKEKRKKETWSGKKKGRNLKRADGTESLPAPAPRRCDVSF